jgi:peptide deformylase
MPVPIVYIGDPILRQRAKPVTDFKASEVLVQRLIADLHELQGAGLAANQIGLDLNIFVAEVKKTDLFPDREESPLTIMLNAEIVGRSQEMITFWEGCFSVPGYLGEVPRHQWLDIKYQTRDGEHRQERISGYLARVIQHETDHLLGKFYIDRMPDMSSFMTREYFIRTVTEAKQLEQTEKG